MNGMSISSRILSISVCVGALVMISAAPVSKPAFQADSLQAACTELYLELAQRLENGDFSANITDLRMAYAGSSLYRPYDIVCEEHCLQGRDAMEAGNYTDALGYFYKAMRPNYLLPKAHMGAEAAFSRLGLSDIARFHTPIVAGIALSIMRSGDGQSCDSAFVVIGNWETYFLIHCLGLEPMGQALLDRDGRFFDRMFVRDEETGVEDTLYFDISLILDWNLNRMQRWKLAARNREFNLAEKEKTDDSQ